MASAVCRTARCTGWLTGEEQRFVADERQPRPWVRLPVVSLLAGHAEPGVREYLQAFGRDRGAAFLAAAVGALGDPVQRAGDLFQRAPGDSLQCRPLVRLAGIA